MKTHAAHPATPPTQFVAVPVNSRSLGADLCVPADADGLVIFAHGSGSSRLSPRNRAVARALNRVGLATLLVDLLTPDEESHDAVTAEHRFDIPFLAERLGGITDWALTQPTLAEKHLGYFGASTGAAAAIQAAARRGSEIEAIVSRGGRPDLAYDALPLVRAATLLIVGSRDELVLELNHRAYERLGGERMLTTIPGATHLFEEPGAMDTVARMAGNWFAHYLAGNE